jgi:hypothetical protein
MERWLNRALKIGGDYRVVDGVQILQLLSGADDYVLLCSGTTLPVSKKGFSKGCFFVKTNGDADSSIYVNVGSSTSSNFVLIENRGSTLSLAQEESTVYTAEVTLTTANLKALRATPIQVVAAPGAGKMIEFLGATLKYDYATAALTENSCNLGFRYHDGSGLQVSETIEATGWIDQAADTTTNAIQTKDRIVASASAENKKLVIHNVGGEEIGGTGGGVVNLYVRYRILTL